MEEKKKKEFLKELVNLDQYEKKELFKMLKADDLSSALFDIANDIFRPARKHGYSDKRIEELINKCGESDHENEYERVSYGCELIHLLENKFYEILEDNGIQDLID